MAKLRTALLLISSVFSLTACGESDPDVKAIQDTKPVFFMGDSYKEGFDKWSVCGSVKWEKMKEDVTRMYEGRDVVRVTCNVDNVDDYAEKLKSLMLDIIAKNPDKSTAEKDKATASLITNLDSIQLNLYFLPPNGSKPRPYLYAYRYKWKDGKSGVDIHRPEGFIRVIQGQKKDVFDLMFSNKNNEYSNGLDARAMATLFMSMRKD
ncbi:MULTISPECIES: hypothetical protein [Kosakonia]|uniref:hypothetical protein n=1 Tax=Kosakonia TaxID=1330547 RepID=UPI000A3C9A5A|nr:hypothetical protein [Kosakonia pseudosacchari]